MSDYYEIDFLPVEARKSGDAITIRYSVAEKVYIHVVDGGFQAAGEKVCQHIRQYYGNPTRIDHVVATHSDGDHLGGLRTVLEQFDVGALWLLRPWQYAGQIIHRFSTYESVARLQAKLREIYFNVDALEEIALRRGIPIYEPFQGAQIGHFTVLAPTKDRYLDLIVDSEKTPESVEAAAETAGEKVAAFAEKLLEKAKRLFQAAWGEEVFSANPTSAENEMSVVQYANLGSRILLTGDAGIGALNEAADFAPRAGLMLPGIDRFQVPHHGSRRNVSTEILDRILGQRIYPRPTSGEVKFTALISSALEDTDHPRNSVVRAMIHRGAKVIATEGRKVCSSSSGAPERSGWTPIEGDKYPEEQESD